MAGAGPSSGPLYLIPDPLDLLWKVLRGWECRFVTTPSDAWLTLVCACHACSTIGACGSSVAVALGIGASCPGPLSTLLSLESWLYRYTASSNSCAFRLAFAGKLTWGLAGREGSALTNSSIASCTSSGPYIMYPSGGLDFLRILCSIGGSDRYLASATSSVRTVEGLPLFPSCVCLFGGFFTVPVGALLNYKSLILALLAAVLASSVKSAPPQFVFVLSLLST